MVRVMCSQGAALVYASQWHTHTKTRPQLSGKWCCQWAQDQVALRGLTRIVLARMQAL